MPKRPAKVDDIVQRYEVGRHVERGDMGHLVAYIRRLEREADPKEAERQRRTERLAIMMLSKNARWNAVEER